MYKVVKAFTDLQDDNYVYLEGSIYPREGANPSAERIAELATTKNIRGEVLIEAVDTSKSAEIKPVKGEKTAKDAKADSKAKTPKKANKKEK